MADQFSPLMVRIVAGIERLLSAKPERVATVNVGRGPRVPVDQTTGANPSARRSLRASSLASLMWDPYEQGRPARYLDFREMAEEVPELDRALMVKRDFVFAGEAEGNSGHSHDMTFGARARPELRRVLEQARADLPVSWSSEVYHEGHWLGDSATELLGADGKAGFVGERYIPPESFRIEQSEGYPIRYWYTPQQGDSEARPLHPFFVLHFAPNRRRGSHYGRSDWAAARGLRRSEEAIQSLLVMLALKKASGEEKVLWPFARGTSLDEMWQHIRSIEAEIEDFHFDYSGELKKKVAAQLETVPKFIPWLWDKDGASPPPTFVQSKAADLLQLLQVIQHFQERYFIVTGTPAALVGLERNVNARSTLVEQGVHFALTVRKDQKDVVALLTDYYTRAALAAGIVPQPDEFAVSMAPPSSLDEGRRAEVAKLRSETVANLVTAGMSLRDALIEGYAMAEARADDIAAGATPRTAAAISDRLGLPPDQAKAAEAVLESALGIWRNKGAVVLDGASRLHAPGNQPPAEGAAA